MMSYFTFSFIPILMPCLSVPSLWFSFMISDPGSSPTNCGFLAFSCPLYLFLPLAFRSCSCSFQVWVPFCQFLHYLLFTHLFVAIPSQPPCLYSFHNVLSLQVFLDLWDHQSLINFFHYSLWAIFLSNILSFSFSPFVRLIVLAP